MSENAVRAALRKRGYTNDDMTAHGFRAMARTMLDEILGYPVEWIEQQLWKLRTSPRTALALIATTVQGIQLKACRGLLKLNNAEMVLLSKPRRAWLSAGSAALQFLRRTRAIRCERCLAPIHLKLTQSKHGTYSQLP